MIPLGRGRLMSRLRLLRLVSRLRRKTLTIQRRPDVRWAPAEPSGGRKPLEPARAWKLGEPAEAPPVRSEAALGPDVTIYLKCQHSTTPHSMASAFCKNQCWSRETSTGSEHLIWHRHGTGQEQRQNRVTQRHTTINDEAGNRAGEQTYIGEVMTQVIESR